MNICKECGGSGKDLNQFVTIGPGLIVQNGNYGGNCQTCGGSGESDGPPKTVRQFFDEIDKQDEDLNNRKDLFD